MKDENILYQLIMTFEALNVETSLILDNAQ